MQIMTSIRAASVAIALSLGFAAAANATTISSVENYSAYSYSNSPGFATPEYAGDAGYGDTSRIYERFLLPTFTAGTNISSAYFTIASFARFNNAHYPLALFQVTNDSWTITDWASKPALGTMINAFNPGQGTTSLSFDVTAFIDSQYSGDGKASFAIAGVTEGSGQNSWTYFLDNAELTYTLGTVANANAVPEPASIALLGLGLAGIASLRRRKQ